MSTAELCPVCGFGLGFEAWQGGSPSHEICPCCGIQFGYYDAAPTKEERVEQQIEFRRRWVADGMKWDLGRTKPPPNWNPFEQFQKIGISVEAAKKTTVQTIRSMKHLREKIAALTAYDYPMTKLLDEAGVPFIFVGDSLGMVVLGYPDTTHVTMAEMEHHVRAAARAKPNGLLGADLPFKSYETPDQASENSKRLVAAGAEFVKAEGGVEILPQVRAILAAGIPFCGHLGMLPQHILEEGGKYHVKGRDDRSRGKLFADASALADAGAFAVVLELVAPPVAKEISEKISIPTIGIGSGPDCDGQILVIHDLVGLFPWFTPRFVKPRANCAAEIKSAVAAWKQSLAKA